MPRGREIDRELRRKYRKKERRMKAKQKAMAMAQASAPYAPGGGQARPAPPARQAGGGPTRKGKK